MDITPLKYVRVITDAGQEIGCLHGGGRYRTDDELFAIAHRDGQWQIGMELHVRAANPLLFQSFCTSGLPEARFERRCDTVDALQSFAVMLDDSEPAMALAA